MGKKQNAQKIDYELALQLYELGWNDREISTVFGVKRETITLWRKRNGLKSLKGRGRPRQNG